MTAAHQDCTIVSGDSRTLRFTVTGENGAALNLAGAEAVRWGCVRKRADGKFAPPAAVERTLGAGISITDAASGIIEVVLAPADTAGLAGGRYHHELQLTDAAGAVSTLAVGELTIVEDLLT